MADQNLSELLTEFQNLAESEHHGYIDSIVSRPENATTIFAALTFFEVKIVLFLSTKYKWYNMVNK